MLGRDLYRIDVNAELSNERLKSLVFFYGPLVGRDALSLYQYLVLCESTPVFDELNNLLSDLNISVDYFEKQCGKLNEYRLLKTLKKNDKYIFVFNNPLSRKDFIKDDIFVREFILKTSGKHFQNITADIMERNSYDEFDDVSETISLDAVRKWSEKEETYLRKPAEDKYEFNTRFNVNSFLKNVSRLLFPFRFRTKENLRQIAILGDLYNISYEQMQSFLPRVIHLDSEEFDLNQLKYLCMSVKGEYHKSEQGQYNEAPLNFLMSLQDGKELTKTDKDILYELSNEYYLNSEVINVLLEYALRTCDNHLYKNFLFPIASDLHRNGISKAKDAIEYLNKSKDRKEEKLPVYDNSRNKKMSDEELEELLSLRGNNG